ARLSASSVVSRTAVFITRGASRAASTAATAVIVVVERQLHQRVQRSELRDVDLGRVAILAVLVLPFAGLDLALDANQVALLEPLLDELDRLLVPDRDRVPLGL